MAYSEGKALYQNTDQSGRPIGDLEWWERAGGLASGVGVGMATAKFASRSASEVGSKIGNASKNFFKKAPNTEPVGGARPATGEAGSGVSNSASYPENARYAQKTYRTKFDDEGKFKGETVDTVTQKLKLGKMSIEDVPIDYIFRDGNALILNTRSSQALEAAGIPRSKWQWRNRTGQADYETRLTGQLSRNKLTSEGVSTVRRSNGEE
ncbi:hypothetical protein ACE5IS_18130 [Leptospira wolffii]|uniref:Uncharacterized protein n=1 Tax=Leptospira wolffii TaxID=409998 RepID=A0ABV5BSC3_9LEPT